jgi:ribosomal-protein-alanine N-acetyltransferase
MQIRKMEEYDAEKVAKIEAENFSVPWSKQSFLDSIPLAHTLFFVAEEAGEIAGYCGIYLAQEEGELVTIAVTQQMRRKGIARRLLDEAVRILREREVQTLYLEVRVSNEPAIRLYESMGFTSEGIRKGFYEKPREDARIMKLEMEKAVQMPTSFR